MIKDSETIASKRPASKKSDDSATSIRVRNIENSSKNSKKTNSLNHHENYSDIPPKVTAKSWILYEMRRGRFLYGKRTKKTREMASLTKMMNLITIL
jgi:D-alanyl-D-alanine carboxypeptidase